MIVLFHHMLKMSLKCKSLSFLCYYNTCRKKYRSLIFHESNIQILISAMTSTSISLEITNAIKDCDNGYIEIRCVFNVELKSDFAIISLRRLEADVVSVSEGVVFGELANRSGVAVNSFLRDVSTSYLSIRIMSSVVKPLKDKGPYQCFLHDIDTSDQLIVKRFTLEMLNITGNTTTIFHVS